MCNCFNHVNNKRSLKDHALFSLTNIRRIFCVTILKRFKFFLKWRNAKKDDFPSRYFHPRRQIRIQNITFICNYIFSKNVFQKSLRIIKWNVNSDLIKKVYTHFRRLIPSCAIHFLYYFSNWQDKGKYFFNINHKRTKLFILYRQHLTFQPPPLYENLQPYFVEIIS